MFKCIQIYRSPPCLAHQRLWPQHHSLYLHHLHLCAPFPCIWDGTSYCSRECLANTTFEQWWPTAFSCILAILCGHCLAISAFDNVAFSFFTQQKNKIKHLVACMYIYILCISNYMYIYIWNWSPYSQSNRQNKPFSSGQMCQLCCTHEWKTQ